MANPAGVDQATTNSKRRKLPGNHHDNGPNHNGKHSKQPFIPGLPDHIAQMCLSHVKPTLLYSVCHSWRKLIYVPYFPPFLSLYAILTPTSRTNAFELRCNRGSGGVTNETICGGCANDDVRFFCYDPISSRWHALPQPPLQEDPPLGLLLRHPCFISRHLPVQSVSVAGRLVLLAATASNFAPALSRPLLFNPISGKWSQGPPLAVPRRWCALGSSGSSIYVASGIGSQFSAGVAKSMEKWELNHQNGSKDSENYDGSCSTSSWEWEKMRGMKDGRFSRDAISAVAWKGKLCMVNVEGDAAKEGVIYDMEHDEWLEMPVGMVAGWKGPAVAVNEEVMYVVDETLGVLRKYDEVRDIWVDVIGFDRLKGATQVDYGGGRICVVCGGGGGIVVIDVVATPVRLVLVDVPVGFEAIAVHVLPRLPA